MPRRKARRTPGLTRERILSEAARLFNRQGFHGTSLDHIARTLGVTKAALYYYVKSKEDILFQCNQRALELGLEAIRHAMVRISAPAEQLREALRYYIEVMTDQLMGGVVLLGEGALAARHHRRILAMRDEYERMLRKIVTDGIDSGVFVPCDPRLIGFAILGAVHWISRWYNPGGERSAKEIAEAFTSYLVRGLERTPSVQMLGSVSRPAAARGADGRAEAAAPELRPAREAPP